MAISIKYVGDALVKLCIYIFLVDARILIDFQSICFVGELTLFGNALLSTLASVGNVPQCQVKKEVILIYNCLPY